MPQCVGMLQASIVQLEASAVKLKVEWHTFGWTKNKCAAPYASSIGLNVLWNQSVFNIHFSMPHKLFLCLSVLSNQHHQKQNTSSAVPSTFQSTDSPEVSAPTSDSVASSPSLSQVRALLCINCLLTELECVMLLTRWTYCMKSFSSARTYNKGHQGSVLAT